MIRTHSISIDEASLMAVAALDEWVHQVVKASGYRVSARFFDWIADEATTLVERNLLRSFHSGEFASELCAGDPRIALARWVGQWVAPHAAVKFSRLVPYLPLLIVDSLTPAQTHAEQAVNQRLRIVWLASALTSLLRRPRLVVS